jgi:hypothetical protein
VIAVAGSGRALALSDEWIAGINFWGIVYATKAFARSNRLWRRVPGERLEPVRADRGARELRVGATKFAVHAAHVPGGDARLPARGGASSRASVFGNLPRWAVGGGGNSDSA